MLMTRRGQMRILESIIACVLILMTYFYVERSNFSISTRAGSQSQSSADNLLRVLENQELIIDVVENSTNWEAQIREIIESSIPSNMFYNVTFCSLITDESLGSSVTNISNMTLLEGLNAVSVKGVYTLSYPLVQKTNTLLDVIMVMDRSGSMAYRIAGDTRKKLDYTQIAAKNFIDKLSTETDQVGLTSFSSSGSLDHVLTDDFPAVKTKIDALVANGATNMMEGISKANVEFASARAQENDVKVMILLSDGVANLPGDEEEAAAAAEAEADELKTTWPTAKIFTIGLGNPSDLNEVLLREIQTDGYYKAPSAQDLDLIYQSIAEKIMSEVRYDVVLITVTLIEPIGG